MKRMIIFCMLFFCSSMVLTAASPETVKYRQLHKTIEQLETLVKDKDAELLHTPENPVKECLYTVVTCFKKGIEKLQPVSSKENTQFNKTINVLRKWTFRDSGECKPTCESYDKKTPKVFLKAFANLIQMLFKN